MKNKLVLVFVAVYPFITTGCSLTSSTMIQHPDYPKVTSSYTPESYRSQLGKGKVRYLDEGTSLYRDARRTDALKKMNSSCRGPFKIINEYRLNSYFGYKTDADPDGQRSLMELWARQYMYIEFECEPLDQLV